MLTAALFWSIAKTLLWILLGFGAYAVLLRRMAMAVQPVRLRLAEEGEALLAEGRLSPQDENDVVLFLDNAFNGWMPVFLMVLMPAAIFLLAKGSPAAEECPPNPAVSKLSGMFAISIFAANPLMGTAAVIEFILLALIAIVFTGSLAALLAAIRRAFHSLTSWRMLKPVG
jgi:hypothetical protein